MVTFSTSESDSTLGSKEFDLSGNESYKLVVQSFYCWFADLYIPVLDPLLLMYSNGFDLSLFVASKNR